MLSKNVIKTECVWCGSKKYLEKHHIDYNKPLIVMILCRKCHLEWHRKYQPKNRQGKCIFLAFSGTREEMHKQFKIWCANNDTDMTKRLMEHIKNDLGEGSEEIHKE